jgi:epsilon-lactone hydrolase
MPSIQSRFIMFGMRNMHLLRFQRKQQAWDWNTSIPQFREQCEKSSRMMAKLPEGVTVTPVQVDGLAEGLSAEWITPAGAPADRVILYTHGGGYVSGNCADHRSIVAKFAKAAGLRTLLYDYRLAPEHPFPAAMEDTLAVYRWLLAQGIAPANILIAGESAGGGLCLAALVAIKDVGLPLPSAGVALSPWTDLTLSGESYRANARLCLSPPGMSQVCSAYYVGENDPHHPWISPLFGDLRGLPPVLIIVGGDETMRDDSVQFAEKARAAGVDVTLRVVPGMFHCFPLLAPAFPEATQAMAEIIQFVQTRIGQAVETVAV